ncbi:MAG: hypothetical protein K8S00_07365 [Bacteroidales bacterium]|nr:hypothetical protein [Bacteroidales bacterium]
MPGRNFNSDEYRFGFQGQEKDDELKGVGNSINYLARIYDPRLGKFLSVDPLTKEYPWYTPYQFAGNKPIAFIDRDGEEEARPEEKKYAVLNFVDALYVKANRTKAVKMAQASGLPNPRDGEQDAFRHTIWNAMNARDIGADDAEPFATLHERGSNPANDPNDPSYDPVAIEMDLYNNQVGREIGEANPDATDEELAGLVLGSLNSGELKIIKQNDIGEPVDNEGRVITDNTEKVITTKWHPPLAIPKETEVKQSDNDYNDDTSGKY